MVGGKSMVLGLGVLRSQPGPAVTTTAPCWRCSWCHRQDAGSAGFGSPASVLPCGAPSSDSARHSERGAAASTTAPSIHLSPASPASPRPAGQVC